MLKQLLRLTLILILVSVACSLPVATTPQPQNSLTPVPQQLVKAGSNSTKTPTPFQPNGPTSTLAPPTSTPTATATNTATFTLTPTATDEILGSVNVPPPVRITDPMPDGMVNLMVLGSDYRPGAGYRTDVIMLFSINTKKGTVSVTSFPRDLYVEIPGWMIQRINTAQAHGGFNMLQETMQFNFGVKPQYYIMTNFQGFTGIIDSLGGIDVNIGQALYDTCDLPWSSYGWCSVAAGTLHMDGATALWYVRSRHSSSDFDRTRRAQEVMLALFKKTMNLDAIQHFPDLYNSYLSSVETNMDLKTMLSLLPVATQVLADNSRIHQYRVGPDAAVGYITNEGANVLLPNYEAIKQILTQAIFGP